MMCTRFDANVSDYLLLYETTVYCHIELHYIVDMLQNVCNYEDCLDKVIFFISGKGQGFES